MPGEREDPKGKLMGEIKKSRYEKAKDITVMLLTKNPNMRATEVLNYLNMYLDKKEVPSIQHISRNWVNQQKSKNITLNWIQVNNLNKKIETIKKELETIKNMINRNG